MTLNIATIVLDGMPWLPCIFAELNRLPPEIDWCWHIAEGASAAESDTAWMNGQSARLSRDGTHEFLLSLNHHPRVFAQFSTLWSGKTAQLNALCERMARGGILLQQDSDEIWTAQQYLKLIELFDDMSVSGAMFWMRYFVGPNLVTTSQNGYGNKASMGEWRRAWRFHPGQRFDCHEPPVFAGNKGRFLSRDETREALGVIDHYAWATARQAAMKQVIYGNPYQDALSQWTKLQHAEMPLSNLESIWPWVGPGASVDRIY